MGLLTGLQPAKACVFKNYQAASLTYSIKFHMSLFYIFEDYRASRQCKDPNPRPG